MLKGGLRKEKKKKTLKLNFHGTKLSHAYSVESSKLFPFKNGGFLFLIKGGLGFGIVGTKQRGELLQTPLLLSFHICSSCYLLKLKNYIKDDHYINFNGKICFINI